ncbi:MAG: reprolysin-like metallopeptidase [Bacteroidota bacterium]
MKPIYAALTLAFMICIDASSQIEWNNNQNLRNASSRSFNHECYETNFELLKSHLEKAPSEWDINEKKSEFYLNIPIHGQEITFSIVQTNVMHPKLAARFPEIQTFIGYEEGGNGYARFDYTHKGFHAWIKKEGKTYFAEPLNAANRNQYAFYSRKDFFENYSGQSLSCEVVHDLNENKDLQINQKALPEIHQHGQTKASGDELRTYRLALACTGEYATFHGGTVADVMDEFVVAMNRVNGIYETEVAIRMELVPNNDDLIYLDGTTDPYTNNSGGTMLGENISTCNSVIGSANYDIGHVFSTGGGGVAYLNAPCGGNKAGGVTGLGSPVNDPFYVDYVCHEIGHQFGGRHTQNNSCNRSSSAAYEPGSASTIMGYAGICAPNIQSNSDDHFHVHSYDEIIAFSQTANGNTCAATTTTGNNAPAVTVPASGFFIPKGTPFKLEGSATDPDGHALMYRWDEHDLGPATAAGDNTLTNPSGTQPVFRSWPATTEPVRYCPRLEDIVNNTSTIGEHLPDYARELSFRLVALDFQLGGGGVEYGEVTFEMADNSGPFAVNFPNGGEEVGTGSAVPVAWDVSNSDMAPVSCSEVDILLSTDGGFTYPFTLASNVPNDGAESVIIPGILSTTARIMVKDSDNIFFDISNSDFEIAEGVSVLNLDLAVNGISSPLGVVPCGEPINAEFEFINLGVDPITSFEYSYQIGTEAPVLNTWSGNIAIGEAASISLQNLVVTDQGQIDFTVAILDVNGQGLDENNLNDNSSVSFSYLNGSNEVNIQIDTDCWGNEVTWEFRDDLGTVLASGGPYANNSTNNEQIDCLPDACYTFEIFDSYGDGMAGSLYTSCGVDGNYTLTDAFGNVLVQMGDANYGSGISHEVCVPVPSNLFASFEMSSTSICEGESVNFTDTSLGNVDGWSWNLLGGDPANSDQQNPTAQFNTAGSYDIELTVTEGPNTSSITQTLTVNANSIWYADVDGDGYGNPNVMILDCAQPTNYVDNNGDCNDNDININPDASEICDGLDNNCDNSIDEGLLTTYYVDNDGDGYGDASNSIEACEQPAGYADNALDCHDGNEDINPAAEEICDGIDNNCDGDIDEGLVFTYYVDNDGDGFGNPNQSVTACSLPPGFVENSDDCDDSNDTVYLGAEEICGDGIDNDCDGLTEEDCEGCFEGSVPAPSGLQNQLAQGGYLLSWTPIPESVACQINGGAVAGPQVSINIIQNEPSQRFVSSSILTPGATYQWRVRCACQITPSIIVGPFSGYNYFTVPLNNPLNQDVKLSLNELTIYPNPVEDQFNVKGLEPNTSFEVLNMLGEVVHSGVYRENQPVNIQLDNGLYIFSAKDDWGNVSSSKFLVVN